MKYEITYSCGHEGVVSLFGKGSDREYQLKRYGQRVCPDCYKKQLNEENKALGVVLHLTCDHDTDTIEIIAYGDTYAHKEELKALGFKFGEIECTFMPSGKYGQRQKCWYYIPNYSTPEELKNEYDALVARVKEGVTTHVSERKPEEGDRPVFNKILLGRKQELERKAAAERAAEEAAVKEKAAREERARLDAERREQEKRNKFKRIAIPAECARNIGGISGNIRIQFPAESRLAGYSFIVGGYCVFEGSHDGELYLELYRNFEKRATKLKRLEKRNKQGKWYELVDPVTITRKDVIECFGNEVAYDAPKTERANLVYDSGEEIINHIPEPKTPVEIDAAENLKR
ncbi:hypothetical protein [uncultured Akkermansia sp.]|uniref:hypothetical protein n=1 Tax=uncultured Akkermansia sp. TaxID=512294 RepID=UPI00265CE0F8|nr:hypothetical protein [uncultured Akkermansia sp.]